MRIARLAVLFFAVVVLLGIVLPATVTAQATPAPVKEPGSSSTLYPEAWSQALKDLQAAATIAAIVAGGFWAYFKFLRGRTYRIRLEPVVGGTVATKNGITSVTTEIRVKNVGLSRANIKQEGTGLRLLSSRPILAKETGSVDWDHLASFSVFTDHQWIEPGETVSEQSLYTVDADSSKALRLELIIAAKKTVWKARRILQVSEPDKPASPTV